VAVTFILLVAVILVKNEKSAGLETKGFCIENRYNILNNEMDLRLQLVGQKIPIEDNSHCSKIILANMERDNKTYDFRRDLESAMEYYSDKKDSLQDLKDTKLIYLTRDEASPVLGTIRKKYKDKVKISKESSDVLAEKFSIPPKGVIVLYLNKDNICLYAYYLEQNNARKVMENSPVIFQLIKNVK
jgi:hypothetical protein